MTSKVTQLGYFGYRSAHLDEWEEIARNIIGAEVLPREPGDPLKLRFDEREHRVIVYPHDREEQAFYGWEVLGKDALEGLAGSLEGDGVKVERGSNAEAAERGVMEFVRFRDPDGTINEAFYGPNVSHLPPSLGRGVKGFSMSDLGLGHVNLVCKKLSDCYRFYEKLLGFKVSDYIRWDDADASFFHCNPRHHSLGLMNECFGQVGPSLNHLMIEYEDIDDLGRAYDAVCARGDLNLVISYGKHSNDHMTSFYFKTPSGFAVELGCGGRLVGEDWEISMYSSPKLWGHHVQG